MAPAHDSCSAFRVLLPGVPTGAVGACGPVSTSSSLWACEGHAQERSPRLLLPVPLRVIVRPSPSLPVLLLGTIYRAQDAGRARSTSLCPLLTRCPGQRKGSLCCLWPQAQPGPHSQASTSRRPRAFPDLWLLVPWQVAFRDRCQEDWVKGGSEAQHCPALAILPPGFHEGPAAACFCVTHTPRG